MTLIINLARMSIRNILFTWKCFHCNKCRRGVIVLWWNWLSPVVAIYNYHVHSYMDYSLIKPTLFLWIAHPSWAKRHIACRIRVLNYAKLAYAGIVVLHKQLPCKCEIGNIMDWSREYSSIDMQWGNSMLWDFSNQNLYIYIQMCINCH